MATIYQCPYQHTHNLTPRCAEMNQGKRPRCKGCKSPIRIVAGHAVLIPWRGDGEYQLSDAVKEYATLAAAERAATLAYERDNRSTLVARFI